MGQWGNRQLKVAAGGGLRGSRARVDDSQGEEDSASVLVCAALILISRRMVLVPILVLTERLTSREKGPCIVK